MLEAIYGDDLQHDEGESTNATELAAHLAALEVNAIEAKRPGAVVSTCMPEGAREVNATEAATTSGAARTGAVRVAFSIKLDGGGGGGGGSGGGGGDDVSLPPDEVRLHVSRAIGLHASAHYGARPLSHRYACTSRFQRAIGLHASAHYGARPLSPQVRLHVSLPTGYPHQKVMPRFMLSHHMLRDQVSSLIAC